MYTKKIGTENFLYVYIIINYPFSWLGKTQRFVNGPAFKVRRPPPPPRSLLFILLFYNFFYRFKYPKTIKKTPLLPFSKKLPPLCMFAVFRIRNLFDFLSDPDPDPYFRKWIRIRIKMKRIRNTGIAHFIKPYRDPVHL